MVTNKGCKIALNTVEKIFELSSLAGNADAYARIEAVGRARFAAAVIDDVKAKFPMIECKPAESIPSEAEILPAELKE